MFSSSHVNRKYWNLLIYNHRKHLLVRRFAKFCYSSVGASSVVEMKYTKFDSSESESDETQSPLITLHSLFGSKSNWQTMAKDFSQTTGRVVYAVDARNHGDSPHSDQFTYELMASDTEHFMNNHSIKKTCLLGHSMGGRVALVFALNRPERVEKLIVEDISPYVSKHHPDMMLNYIRIMKMVKLDDSLPIEKARNLAVKQLNKRIKNKGTCYFLASNLEKTDKGIRWRINLEALEKNFRNGNMAFPEIVKKCQVPSLFIAGLRSDYITRNDEGVISDVFPNSLFVYMNTGHWVHWEDPVNFSNAVTSFLNE